jgi:mRNA-degrading endonuclease RelE of RelBE toxin-antitoxin system
MKYAVFYTEQAEAELLSFPAKVQAQLKKKIERLQHGFAGDIKKLEANDNLYRLRSGNYRVLFELDGPDLVILTIRDRKEAYE